MDLVTTPLYRYIVCCAGRVLLSREEGEDIAAILIQKHAGGLYSPPAYLYDEMSSNYDHFLTDGPQNVLSDTEKGMDGTVKHYTLVGNERVCDSITDRYNNATVMAYTTVSIGGVNKALLNTVTDPSGRVLTFSWQDLNAADPAHPALVACEVDLDRNVSSYIDTNGSDAGLFIRCDGQPPQQTGLCRRYGKLFLQRRQYAIEPCRESVFERCRW